MREVTQTAGGTAPTHLSVPQVRRAEQLLLLPIAPGVRRRARRDSPRLWLAAPRLQPHLRPAGVHSATLSCLAGAAGPLPAEARAALASGARPARRRGFQSGACAR